MGPVDHILVHELDRFSHNRKAPILLESLLRKHGVQIKSSAENDDPETPQGVLYEEIVEVIDREVARISLEVPFDQGTPAPSPTSSFVFGTGAAAHDRERRPGVRSGGSSWTTTGSHRGLVRRGVCSRGEVLP
ncbi:MAG: recombinase family protein [Deltaproteobacteria bacterium]|nr:MAG: recombinase family protein [Deltaproteobacteria bacterium]